jgi:hypothetical protein
VDLVVSLGLAQASYLQFDGTDDVVTVEHDASLNITTAISVEAWIRPDTIMGRGLK